jgi:ABC-type transport system involved in multi-copper enzyme maturation permease subunit
MKKCAGMTSLIGIILIYFASSLMSKEYQWKTINFLLTRSSNRISIFISKFLSMIGLYLILIIIVLFYSMIIGIILYGLNFHVFSDLSIVNGEVVEKNLLGSLFIQYTINLLPYLFFVAFSFALSTILKSSGLSLLVGLALFLMSDPVSMFVHNNWWGKYLPFMYTDLSSYLDGVPLADGITIQFSITILIIYIGLLLFVSGFVFNKRDIV